jgi:uncharacterized protein (DUF58 family)
MIVPSRRWLAGAAALAFVAPLAGVWPPAAHLLLLLDGLWLLMLGVDAWRIAGVGGRQIDATREAPPAFSLGRPVPVRYRWTSRAPFALRVRVREAFPRELAAPGGDERRVVLPPGIEVVEEVPVSPVRRGRAEEGRLHLRLLSPFGLAWRQLRIELPWKTIVYPSLAAASLRALPTQAQRRREAGLRAVRRLGEGRIFESLREWVPGDDTRTIDWKATAKRGKTMARQYEDERRQQVLMVIDAGRMLTAEVDGRARLESVVDAALQLAHAAVEHDDNIGVMVFADEVQRFVPPARGRRALRGVLDALATVEGKLVEPDYPAAFAYLAARNRKRALTVVFTDVIDRTASEALVANLGSLRPRHLPLAVALRDASLDRLATLRPLSDEAAFERAAAEELLQAREEALAELRAHGVLILDVPAAGAAKAVVDQYEMLKRRALL